MQATISQAVADKAAKIIGEGRIEWVKGHVYRVQGDSGTYTVHVSFPQEVVGACDCPAGRNKIDRRTQTACSHLIAACAFEIANPIVRWCECGCNADRPCSCAKDCGHEIKPAKSDPFEGI